MQVDVSTTYRLTMSHSEVNQSKRESTTPP